MSEVLFNANKVPATYLKAVGYVLHEWAKLEFALEGICKEILKIGPKETRLLFSQINTRPKIEVYKALVNRYIGVTGFKKLALQIAKNTETLSGVRNKIVHGRWVHPEGKPRTLFLYFVGGSSDNRILPKPYKATAASIQKVGDAIREQHFHAHHLWMWLQAAPRTSNGIYELTSPPGNPRPNGNPSGAATPHQSSQG